MELELIKKKEFPLLSRTRVTFWNNDKGAAPSRLGLKNEVSKILNIKPELVVIKHIYCQFGKSKAKIIAHVYDSKEKMAIFESEKLMAKHQPKDKKEPTEEKKA